MLILLAAACLAWVGILALAFMAFTGSGVPAAWIFSGVLILALAAWFVVMFREFIHATCEPDDFGNQFNGCDPWMNYQTSADRPRCEGIHFRSSRTLVPERMARSVRRMSGLTCEIRPRGAGRPGRSAPR